MFIQKTFQVRRVHTARATENTHAALVLTLAVPLDRIDPYDRGLLLGYQDEEVRVTLQASDLASPAEPRPMERLWSANGGEHTRPGPTEACSECGRVIGEDPDADFYAPLAGPSRPVCGDCAVKLDDQGLAAEADRDVSAEEVEADAEAEAHRVYREALDRGLSDAEAREVAWPAKDVEDEQLGDGPMPERPADEDPVTTPIRRGRGRAASAS